MTAPDGNTTAMKEMDAIVAHLRSIVSKEKGAEGSVVRRAFEELAGKRMFTPPQMRAVFSHASETGKTEVNGAVSQMWPFFQDGFSKITMAYEALRSDQRVEPLLDAMILSRWNAENFPKIMDFEAPKNVPSYPASIHQLSEFRLVPSYIEQSVMPRLKEALAEHLGVEIDSLNKSIKEREEQMIKDGVPGYEALKPIRSWPQAKKDVRQMAGR